MKDKQISNNIILVKSSKFLHKQNQYNLARILKNRVLFKYITNRLNNCYSLSFISSTIIVSQTNKQTPLTYSARYCPSYSPCCTFSCNYHCVSWHWRQWCFRCTPACVNLNVKIKIVNLNKNNTIIK